MRRRVPGGVMFLLLLLGLCALILLGLKLSSKPGISAMPEGWTALRDDGLAAAHAPLIRSSPDYGPLLVVYYRAARAPDGSVFIAYHPVWAGERNPARGVGPFLSRLLYTGGLSLQHLMYGPGDVEALALELDASGRPRRVRYERPKDYSEADFSVTHEAVLEALPELREGERALFETVSWNHLFAFQGTRLGEPDYRLEYFSPELWVHYGMSKEEVNVLRRNRAQFDWEAATAP